MSIHEIHSDEDILQSIRNAKKQIPEDEILTGKKYQELETEVSFSTILQRLEKWDYAKYLAGLDPSKNDRSKFTDEEKKKADKVWQNIKTKEERMKQIEKIFKQMEGRHEVNKLRQIIKEKTDVTPMKTDVRAFYRWNKEKDNNLKITSYGTAGNRGRRQLFIKNTEKTFKEKMHEKYEIPEEHEELFFKFVGLGYRPKTILGTLEYLETDKTQDKAGEKHDVSSTSIRKFLRKLEEEEIYSREKIMSAKQKKTGHKQISEQDETE